MAEKHNIGPVLFFAEAVTLAHVARPMVLAQALSSAGYEIHFACDPRYQSLFGDWHASWHPIDTIPGSQFLNALAKGSPLYSAKQLQSYVEEDLRVIKAVAPALIVGDFRLSLSISARLAKVPYMAISNAYWSPYARQTYPLPELPMNRLVGVKAASLLFSMVRPVAFALHTMPLNKVRKRYGLASLGWDLRRIYTDGDHVLYADIPELIPTFSLPANHHQIGAINWSPSVPLPAWWEELPDDRPVIYVTLGSSGQADRLPEVLQALSSLPVSVIAATAGRVAMAECPDNAWVADYLPGEAAAARAQLVICNGGSPTTMQALTVGVPVLGIPSNLDQYLNMSYLQQAGVGVVIRAGQASAPVVKRAVESMLEQDSWRAQAVKLARQFSLYQPELRLIELVEGLLTVR